MRICISRTWAHYEDANRVWAKFFPKNPPARAIVGVTKMPTDTPVEVTVVAVRDLSRKKVVPGGVMVGDRFLSGFGRDGRLGRQIRHSRFSPL